MTSKEKVLAAGIRAGCIVTDSAGRVGYVTYAPYTVALCNVFWERRLTHDICKNEKLTLLLTKKQAATVHRLLREAGR